MCNRVSQCCSGKLLESKKRKNKKNFYLTNRNKQKPLGNSKAVCYSLQIKNKLLQWSLCRLRNLPLHLCVPDIHLIQGFSLITCNVIGVEGTKHFYQTVSQPAQKILAPIRIILRSETINAQILGAGQFSSFAELEFFWRWGRSLCWTRQITNLAIIHAIRLEWLTENRPSYQSWILSFI